MVRKYDQEVLDLYHAALMSLGVVRYQIADGDIWTDPHVADELDPQVTSILTSVGLKKCQVSFDGVFTVEGYVRRPEGWDVRHLAVGGSSLSDVVEAATKERGRLYE